MKLERLLLDYLDQLDAVKARLPAGHKNDLPIKPVNYIIITDGEASKYPLTGNKYHAMLILSPADDPDVVIINAAKRLDRCNYPANQVRAEGPFTYVSVSHLSLHARLGSNSSKWATMQVPRNI